MNATLYRMEMPEHICPSGLKAKALLQKKGIAVEDRKLTSREQTDAFKLEHGVQTTPQIWIDGKRIGGFDDLKTHLGDGTENEASTSYTPVKENLERFKRGRSQNISINSINNSEKCLCLSGDALPKLVLLTTSADVGHFWPLPFGLCP